MHLLRLDRVRGRHEDDVPRDLRGRRGGLGAPRGGRAHRRRDARQRRGGARLHRRHGHGGGPRGRQGGGRQARRRLLDRVGLLREPQEDLGRGRGHEELLHDPADVHDQGPEGRGAAHEGVRGRHEEGGRLRLLRLDHQGRQALLPRGVRRRRRGRRAPRQRRAHRRQDARLRLRRARRHRVPRAQGRVAQVQGGGGRPRRRVLRHGRDLLQVQAALLQARAHLLLGCFVHREF
mmetsp:Transcript_4017/g.11842  ORF Transcript_4017/g.11842 Transcript_4017/m.11842 type:complete len:234 (+) Transcript_4017:262-963(+)